jgi:hypothetical protein
MANILEQHDCGNLFLEPPIRAGNTTIIDREFSVLTKWDGIRGADHSIDGLASSDELLYRLSDLVDGFTHLARGRLSLSAGIEQPNDRTIFESVRAIQSLAGCHDEAPPRCRPRNESVRSLNG